MFSLCDAVLRDSVPVLEWKLKRLFPIITTVMLTSLLHVSIDIYQQTNKNEKVVLLINLFSNVLKPSLTEPLMRYISTMPDIKSLLTFVA